MPTAAPELPLIQDQVAFNLTRWAELCADPFLASIDHRIETDADGHIIMSPPPAFDHSDRQGEVLRLLFKLAPGGGRARPEAPISTSGGVKAADVIWISDSRLECSVRDNVLTTAPEICVEILSPSNTRAEIDEKRRLYFESGAEEVWICGLDRTMRFFLADDSADSGRSEICPEFPAAI